MGPRPWGGQQANEERTTVVAKEAGAGGPEGAALQQRWGWGGQWAGPPSWQAGGGPAVG